MTTISHRSIQQAPNSHSRVAARKVMGLICVTAALFVSSCGSADNGPNAPVTPKRGCNGCPNFLIVGTDLLKPSPKSDFVAVNPRTGAIAFQYQRATNPWQAAKIAITNGGTLRVLDTLFIDQTNLKDPRFRLGNILPVQWSPYGSNSLLVQFFQAPIDGVDPDFLCLGIVNLDNDSLYPLFQSQNGRRLRPIRNVNFTQWSKYSMPGNDTVYLFGPDGPGNSFHVQTGRLTSNLPSQAIVTWSPDLRQNFTLKLLSVAPSYRDTATINRQTLDHLYRTDESVRSWAWSPDSRFLATFWLSKEDGPMPTVPDGDTMPSERRPCDRWEVCVFDVQNPKLDASGKLQPTHRWNTQAALCKYASFTERIAFTREGNIVMPLMEYNSSAAQLYEITIDGRIVRQVTDL